MVNDIEAYKYNILMTLQSAVASTVTVIAGILVCIVIRLPIGLSPASWSCVLNNKFNPIYRLNTNLLIKGYVSPA